MVDTSESSVGLTPQHIVVTGGASGIGAAVVTALQHQGHTVTVFDLAPAPDGTPTEIVDATDEAAVAAAVEAATERDGTITGLVTCHGIRGEFVPALEMSLDRMRLLYNVHLVGTLSVAREIVRRLHGVAASLVFV